MQPTTDMTSGALPDVHAESTASSMPSAMQAAPPSAGSHWTRLVARPVQMAGCEVFAVGVVPHGNETTQVPHCGHWVAERYCSGWTFFVRRASTQ